MIEKADFQRALYDVSPVVNVLAPGIHYHTFSKEDKAILLENIFDEDGDRIIQFFSHALSLSLELYCIPNDLELIKQFIEREFASLTLSQYYDQTKVCDLMLEKGWKQIIGSDEGDFLEYVFVK